jgi:serine protease Do
MDCGGLLTMSVNNTSGRLLMALVGGAFLSACSPSASTAVPPVETADAATAAMLPTAAQAVATPPPVAAPVQPLVTGLPDFTALVERYGPAVVNVRVDTRPQARESDRRIPPGSPLDDFLRRFGIPELPVDPERIPRRGEGSGFIVSSDGYIMTNAHVVEGADEVIVTLWDRRELEAKVVGLDKRTDVAVLKVEGQNLPTVKIGDPSKLKPGQWVVAIGSPFGMQNSVTAGIISATSRDLPFDGPEAPPPFIQTDAAINPGNSGGPLFNLQGEVIGINSQIYSQSGGYMGLSFAIPIDVADKVREQLIKNGRVVRSMIGVRIQNVRAAEAEAFGLDRPRGALVSDVSPGGPADKAGIRPGDIILSVDGRPVESNSSLPTMISTMVPGTETELEVWRDGKLRKVKLRVVELVSEGTVPTSLESRQGRGQSSPPSAQQVPLGLTVRELTEQERTQMNTQGYLVVERVAEPASQYLRPGDVIIGVAGVPVKTVAELESRINSARRNVALLVQRDDSTQFVTIQKRQ